METRTPDLLITNQLLYQLSYAGLRAAGGWLRRKREMLDMEVGR